ncbi:cyclase family protein [Streptomyces noursei]|uniref:cyclase family protein n=1 Tax=Streptomyces noursei TaxID=1971 RepID=UPI0023B84A30|nr:cyclase family protein [Streptomyces noursei]
MTTRPASADGLPLPRLQECTVLDLSLTLAEDLPCHWPAHQPYQHKLWSWFATRRNGAQTVYNRSGAPYSTRWMAIDEHTGTHFDAPSHFVPPPDSGLPHAGPAGEVTAEQVPVSQLMGPAAVVDLTAPATFDADGRNEGGVSPFITADHLIAWERRHGSLAAGEVVLLRTGWDARYRRGPEGDGYLYDVIVTGRAPGWPAPDVAAVELLLERGVRCVGTDAPSMGAAHDGVPAHVRGLSAGAVYVECLTGLDRLPARGAWFCFLPLKVEGGTGAPGRAVAFVPAPSEDPAHPSHI